MPPPSKEWEPDRTEPVDPVQRPRVSFVGSADTVSREMRDFIDRTSANELIIVSHIYDHAARLRSYEMAAEILKDEPPG